MVRITTPDGEVIETRRHNYPHVLAAKNQHFAFKVGGPTDVPDADGNIRPERLITPRQIGAVEQGDGDLLGVTADNVLTAVREGAGTPLAVSARIAPRPFHDEWTQLREVISSLEEAGRLRVHRDGGDWKNLHRLEIA